MSVLSDTLLGKKYMKKYYKSIVMQLVLMVNKKEFYFGFLINLGYVLLTYLYCAVRVWGRELSTIPAPHAVFALQEFAPFYDIYINIVPFLVVFPFAMSFINDSNNRILPVLQVRSGVKGYYISKAIACFVGGFLAFFVPLIINILLNNITFPQSGRTFIGDLYDMNYSARITGSNIIVDTAWSGIWFPRLFINHPEGYNLLFATFFSAAMGIFSVFVYSVSFILKRQKILLMLPLYVVIVTLNTLHMFMEGKGTNMCYKIMPYITVNTDYGKNPMYIYFFFLLMIIFSIFMISRQIAKDQLE